MVVTSWFFVYHKVEIPGCVFGVTYASVVLPRPSLLHPYPSIAAAMEGTKHTSSLLYKYPHTRADYLSELQRDLRVD